MVLSLLITIPQFSQGQILKRLKKKAEDKIEREAEKRAENRINKKIDDEFDKAEDAIDGKGKKKSIPGLLLVGKSRHYGTAHL